MCFEVAELCPLFRHMWPAGASASWAKRAFWPGDAGATTPRFSDGPFRSHQLQMVMKGSFALVEAEQPALIIPGQGHINYSQEPTAGECGWLPPFGNRRDDVGCEPAHPKQLPEMTVAVL